MPHAAPPRILVVDDNDGVRELWTTALAQPRYQVLDARHGREALDRMRTVVPDLIVLDLRMPEMDGPAFLRALDGAGVPRIPVLIVSGFVEEEELPRASLGRNIVGRLEKPLPLAELLGAVQGALAAAASPA